MPKPLISAVINCRNEAKSLNKALKSLKGFAQEIIVVDMQSTDDSQEIARLHGAIVYPYHWMKVVEPARNYALSKASGKWIILLDPDEYLNKALKNELLKITQRNDVDYVKIPRKNFVFGRWLRHTNSWPDYLIRFFRNGAVTWQKEVHSQPVTRGNCLTLLDTERLAIRHINYSTVSDYVLRALRYATIRAEELKATGYKLKVSDFLLRPVQEFNGRFFANEGYKDGLHGLIFSLLQAVSILLIYVKLWEQDDFPDKTLSKESFISASQESVFEYGHWFTRYFIKEYTSNPIKHILVRIRQWFNRLTKNF